MARELFWIVAVSPVFSGVRGAGLWGSLLESSKLYPLGRASLWVLVCKPVHMIPGAPVARLHGLPR